MVHLEPRDAFHQTDRWRDLLRLVLRHERMYPGIKEWVTSKVQPGLCNRRREAFLAYVACDPIGVVIAKPGRSAKLCHLSVDPSHRRSGLGELLFSVAALQASRGSSTLKFTLPESLWETERQFFNSFAFSHAELAGTQYRLFERELVSKAATREVLRNVVRKLPARSPLLRVDGVSLQADCVISVRPKYARDILSGVKTVEIRKSFSRAWEGKRAVVYSTTPDKRVAGEVTIKRVDQKPPSQVWEEQSANLSCTEAEFWGYCGENAFVSVLYLDEPRPYCEQVELETVRDIVNVDARPPQSHQRIVSGSPWSTIVQYVSLLDACPLSSKGCKSD